VLVPVPVPVLVLFEPEAVLWRTELHSCDDYLVCGAEHAHEMIVMLVSVFVYVYVHVCISQLLIAVLAALLCTVSRTVSCCLNMVAIPDLLSSMILGYTEMNHVSYHPHLHLLSTH